MSRLESKLKPLLRSFVENGPPGCALSVSRNGEMIFEDYVGLSDIDTQKEIKPDTIYRIYSMTKVVTCTAALMLFERGLFLLNDPLEEYLPEFKDPLVYRTNEKGEIYTSPAARSITVKDLFTMTSGLTYPGEGNETERQVGKAMQELHKQGEKLTNRALAKSLASIPLAFDPGTKWQYGLSHDVLGAFIEVITGKSFGQFLKDEIFEPLHMKDTFFRIPEEKRDRLSSNYTWDENGKLRKNTDMDSHIQPDATFESGGGGLLSTLGDYSRFAQMLANGGELDGERIIGRKTIELMSSNHLTPENNHNYNWGYLSGYGYGLGVRTLVDPALGGINSSIGEFGWSGLLGTWVLIDPKENLSAVYMQQMLPNLEAYHQPRLRAVIYGEV
ncbi:serine hydrolase domain-containing protein [Lederbergia wuyishanensis]|uniref:CubicO group peptidase (Beta-lactamase class C family) n=1 Tax=Lederbergia wuyishanensis TaxID=1347903 RepID=A0ABU0D2Z3_9BACI|nr:serine hydrolase domain-containing protein [Lederbergia wuyishanensis]MCJ8007084.1 beta-lactamase family protein [Lederbergia wuyishanensis]MDQ0342772.1 CubicO group peptidase (beta-lactamase class C family) [Lederbergia wuyishanensis]